MLSGILSGNGHYIMHRCSLADAFSQVPLYLRQTVTTVTSIPKDQTSAYTARQQITLFSKVPVDPNVLVHESSHAQVTFLTLGAAPESAPAQHLVPRRCCTQCN